MLPRFVGQDALNLIVGLPILLGSIWLARRGSLIGLLLWPAALFYVARELLARQGIQGGAIVVALFVVRALITLITGQSAIRAGLRQLAISVAAAAVTFGVRSCLAPLSAERDPAAGWVVGPSRS